MYLKDLALIYSIRVENDEENFEVVVIDYITRTSLWRGKVSQLNNYANDKNLVVVEITIYSDNSEKSTPAYNRKRIITVMNKKV